MLVILFTIDWTYSSNLEACGGGSDYIKLCRNGTGSGYVRAIIHNNDIQVELPVKQVTVGVSGTLLGTPIVGYKGTANYYVSSTCANNYQWYLEKEGQGGYILVQNSSSSSLTLTSQAAVSTYRITDQTGVSTNRIAAPKDVETTFYLFAKVKDASNGSYVNTNIKEITAQGNVNLVVGSSGGGLPELPGFYATVSPNPVANELTLKIESKELNNFDEIYRVTIFNSYGKKVYKAKHNEKEIHINVSDFPFGLYKVYIENKENKVDISFIVD